MPDHKGHLGDGEPNFPDPCGPEYNPGGNDFKVVRKLDGHALAGAMEEDGHDRNRATYGS